jgi:GNAT superfamily N-acetyltransferase
MEVAATEAGIFAWRRIFASAAGITDCEWPDVDAIMCDVPAPPFNGVLNARFDDWASRSADVIAAFDDRSTPWQWWTTPSTTHVELERQLEDAGLTRNRIIGMWRDLSTIEPVESQVPAVGLVATEPGHPELARAVGAFYGLPDSWTPQWEAVGIAQAHAGVFGCLTRSDGESTGCGFGLVTDSTVGLWIIATAPDHRGQGIGAAITGWLLEEGRRRGATQAILGATDMGHGLYRRFGFQDVFDLGVWSRSTVGV